MVTRIRSLALVAAFGLAAPAAVAQTWALGAAYGGVNDVKRQFRLDAFHPRELSAWLDYTVEPGVILRAAYWNIRTTGDQANRFLSINQAPPVQMPDFRVGIEAYTASASYSLFEGFYTSGIFAGAGLYRIEPVFSTSPYAAYQDRREMVFGFHAGVDGNFRIHKHASAVVRLTYHGILSQAKRSLFSASAGLAFH